MFYDEYILQYGKQTSFGPLFPYVLWRIHSEMWETNFSWSIISICFMTNTFWNVGNKLPLVHYFHMFYDKYIRQCGKQTSLGPLFPYVLWRIHFEMWETNFSWSIISICFMTNTFCNVGNKLLMVHYIHMFYDEYILKCENKLPLIHSFILIITYIEIEWQRYPLERRGTREPSFWY